MRRQLLCKIKTTAQTIPLLQKCLAMTGMGLTQPKKAFSAFFFSVLLALLELAGRAVMDLGQVETCWRTEVGLDAYGSPPT